MITGIDKSVIDKLESFEDYLSVYIQLEEESSSFSWAKADLLYNLVLQHGEQSIESLATAISRPRSTISTYVRTARAFLPDKRIPSLPFTMHLEASFADSYDKAKKEFVGNSRFDWVAKAADGNWSARKLKAEIKSGKSPLENSNELFQCMKCGKMDGVVYEYILYRIGKSQDPIKFTLHEDCLNEILSWRR